MLMAPGSSLGGARPKANIVDEEEYSWIAKFPSRNDTIDNIHFLPNGLTEIKTNVSILLLHLRNHGFLLATEGWHLSPAFDINPSTDKDGLALNIDMDLISYKSARQTKRAAQ